MNQRVVIALLRRLGCAAEQIDVVENGRLALEAVQRAPYAVVLMDCEMPEMDGLDATRALRQLDGPPSRTPVLGLTGRAMQEELQECLAAGMDRCLTKPIRDAELRAALEELAGPKAPQADVGQGRPTLSDAGGEAVRIVTAGYPPIPGATVTIPPSFGNAMVLVRERYDFKPDQKIKLSPRKGMTNLFDEQTGKRL